VVLKTLLEFTIRTTEALIADKPEEKKGGGMPDMGGMGGMDGMM